MIKLVIAEDQRIERESLLRNIEWESLGIQVVGAAEDGERAWEIVENQKPDILMTDIVMPILNGVDLANQVNETLPNVKIIFISGHDDFTYVKAAIKSRVCDYILKPYTFQEVTQTLRSTVELCVQEHSHREEESRFKSELMQSRPLLERKHLRDVLLELADPSGQTLSTSRLFNPDSRAGTEYAVIVVKLESPLSPADSDRLDRTLNDFAQSCDGAVTQIHETEYAMAISGSGGLPKNREELRSLAELAKLRIHGSGFASFTLSVSDVAAQVGELAACYRQAVDALAYGLLAGKDKIIVAGDTEQEQPADMYTHRTDKIVQRVKELIYLKYMDDITLNDIVNEVFVSHNHLNNMFKRVTGKNVMKYLVDVRIAKAKEMLLRPDAVIQRVSENVGYTNVSYFSTLFKKHTGMTPAEFREKGGKIQK